MYEEILVPTDGSNEADKATDHAIALANAVGATLHALYVIDLPNAPRALQIMDDEEETRERYREYGQEVTDDVREAAASVDVECVTAMRSGSPHEEIVAYADEEGMDLIVMGTGYRGRIGALLGSTAEKVVRTSDVPVTTVRVTEDEFPGSE
jgi:nucleotide-binding universal stress UspA family protein